MKRVYIVICLLLVNILMSLASPAGATQPQRIRIAAFNFYPAIFQAEDGSVQGFYVDFLKEIAKREQWEIEYVYGNWADGLSRIKSGEVDLLTNVAFTDERARFMDYGKVPLLTVWAELYVPHGSSLNSIRDVQEKKVALVKGDFNAFNFKNLVEKLSIPCTYVEFDSFEEVFKAISAGQVDAGVVNNTFGAAKQREYDLKSSGIVFNPFDIYFTTAKGKHSHLLTALDKYLGEWRTSEDSPYHQARKNWSYKGVSTIKVTPASIRRVMILFVLISCTAVGFVFVLRVQVRRKTSALKQEVEFHKHTEEALRESKLRLDTILNTVAAKIFIKDTQYRYTFANRKFCEILGHSENDILGKDDSAFFAADSLESFMSSDRAVIEQGQTVGIEETDLTVEGQLRRTFWTVKIPLRDSNGDIYGLCGISTDITEHKLLEENLRQQTILLEDELVERQMTQEALQDQAAILEEEVEERRRAEQALVQSEATIRHKLKAIIEPEGDIDTLELSDIVDAEMLQSMMEDFYLITGMAGAVLDTSGKVLVGVGWQDICTKFHRCHPETRKNCIESDTVLTQGVPFGVFNHYRCKNGMWDMVTPLEVGGRHVGNVFIGQFFYEDQRPEVDFFSEQARRYGFDEAQYLAALDRVPRISKEAADAGMQFYAKLTRMVSTLSYSSIKVSRMLAERTHLEEQLRQSQKMEAVGQLAGGVAHDFNNILQVITGYGSLLQMDGKLDARQNKDIEHILTSAEKAAQLTHGLLAFSRKQVMALTPVNLNEIVENVKKFLVRIIGEDIQLKTITDENRLRINADTGQIEQVLINLATNARDAMQKGGLLIIETGLQTLETPIDQESGSAKPGRYAVMTVSDTGCGMDEATCKKIFEPFFTTKEVGKGTGLGMAIVYGIVKQHNGFINVYSEPGQGTAFKIYLPIYRTEQSEKKDEILQIAQPQGGTETILLAEDDEEVRELVVTVLTESGYNVIQAVDGQDVVEKFTEHKDRIAMVLMDMIMPKNNGKEAYQEISLIQPDVRVLYSSGYTADFIQSRGVSEEGIELIMKPMQPMELLRKVREILDRK